MAAQDSSPAAFSATDDFAARSASGLLLIGRILFGYVFLHTGYSHLTSIARTAGYFNSLKIPAPELMVWVVGTFEGVVGVALILGIATRYVSLAVFVFVLITIALAHRYWEYPEAQQMVHWFNFAKNLAIMGGALAFFVTGAGRVSVDASMKK